MRCLIIFAVFGLALVNLCVGDISDVESFRNTRIYKVTVQNGQQLKELWKLTQDLKLHVLQDFQVDRLDYQIVVDPNNHQFFEECLSKLKCRFHVLVDNFMTALQERTTSVPESKMEWTQYHQLDDIYSWLDNLAVQYRGILKVFTIGNSYEGRPIKAVTISLKKGNKAIMMDSNIHAIEWISSATLTCFLHKLLTSKDPEVRQLLWEYDWIFVPVVNPDGLFYTHNVHPLWRKNRKPTGFYNESGICYGTDLNRNFDFHWNGAGYNIKVPCDHWYGGAKPDSEPEVTVLQQFIKSFRAGYIRVYTAVHSFGNMVLLPFGHTTTERPPNYQQMMIIAEGFAKSAQRQFNTTFTYGSSGELNYPVSGAAKDWAYGQGIPFTATIELRDNGTYGFFLPANQIQEVCLEFTDGIVGMLNTAKGTKLFD